MKKFRIEMSYEGKRTMEVSANTQEEALALFRERDKDDRDYDPREYMDYMIDLEEGKGDIVELGDAKEEFIRMCEVYEAEHGVKPRFAQVTIRYKGLTEDEDGMIVCFDKDFEVEDGSALDDELLFHYNGENPVEEMFGDGEDFVIISVEEVFYEV